MDDKSLFMNFWTNESKTTSRVLGRIPEGSDYRPDAKARTAHEIAWQIDCGASVATQWLGIKWSSVGDSPSGHRNEIRKVRRKTVPRCLNWCALAGIV